MTKRYAIQGGWDDDDKIHLQWSDNMGWVHPETADLFELNELFGCLPSETTSIIDTISKKVFTVEEFYVTFQVP